MLVGNKSDLNHSALLRPDSVPVAENNFSFIETSALDASNVEGMFRLSSQVPFFGLPRNIYRTFSSRPSELLVTDIEKGLIDVESSADTGASCSKCCTQ
ncbi:hypothetical protein BD779DRAFT_1502983 [Infundibulicybe gibba]|nr:hypothetical protein BD779DRAFT_1502983 [Infundibulicybe gibba]